MFIENSSWTAQMHQSMPYTCYLGILAGTLNNQFTLKLPYREMLVGNVMLPAIHGGVISGFLESCILVHTQQALSLEKIPQPIDFSLDYLRAGRPLDCYAQALIKRQGRRVSSVEVKAWQDDAQKEIAIGRATLLMPEM